MLSPIENCEFAATAQMGRDNLSLSYHEGAKLATSAGRKPTRSRRFTRPMANERLGLSDEEAIAYSFALLQLAGIITLFALMSRQAKYATKPPF